MFLAQKWMIERANLVAKPIICMGSMLESLEVNDDRLNRRECADVSIAVMDGADVLVINDTNQPGDYVLKTLKGLGRCCAEAERSIDYKGDLQNLKDQTSRDAPSDDRLAASAASSVLTNDLDLIVVTTRTGKLPRLLSKYRPTVPVLALCEHDLVIK